MADNLDKDLIITDKQVCIGRGYPPRLMVFLADDGDVILRINSSEDLYHSFTLNKEKLQTLLLILHATLDAPDTFPQCVLPTHPAAVTGKKMRHSAGGLVTILGIDKAGDHNVWILESGGWIAGSNPCLIHAIAPAPKYRPYTAEEWWAWFNAGGCEVVGKNTGGAVYEVRAVGHQTLRLWRKGGGDSIVKFQRLLDHYEHRDGRPCGVLEEKEQT